MTCEPGYHDCMATACEVCEEIMVWIDCPTGGWWKHIDHPADDHDGEAPVPEHSDGPKLLLPGECPHETTFLKVRPDGWACRDCGAAVPAQRDGSENG